MHSPILPLDLQLPPRVVQRLSSRFEGADCKHVPVLLDMLACVARHAAAATRRVCVAWSVSEVVSGWSVDDAAVEAPHKARAPARARECACTCASPGANATPRRPGV